MKSGGFDVVIGNPPWKEYSAVKREYTVRGYATENCGNLYALCIERCLALRSGNGGLSFIVQLPLSSSSRMADARRLMRRSSLCLHVASFDDRPGKLFEGLQNCRSVVFVARAPGHKSHRGNELATTGYIRWHSQARHGLFERLGYTVCADVPLCPDQFPRFSTESEPAVFQRLAARSANTVGSVLRGRHAENFI
ncbi:MAG: hypothetical protein GW802_35105, partial [Armatimonadetes bacterium]|nr:hypothetical protein [Armatimonadota bacterium]